MALTDESKGNGFYMPVAPAYGGNNDGFGFGGDWAWILLLLLIGGNGWGMGGFGGGMWPMMMGGSFGGFDLYPWLNNSQHISDGFRDQNLNTQISDARTDINRGFGDVQNALCAGFAGVNATVNGGVNTISQQLYNNEIASLNRSFAEQTANAQGFNGVQSGLSDIRYGNASNTRDIIESQTRGTQAILDKLCALELDGVKGQLAQAQRENVALQNAVNMATMQASQVQQTSDIINGTYTRLSQCPVNSTPVYGNQPIFTCPSNNYGCGCGGVA
jgi:hypothetical protein